MKGMKIIRLLKGKMTYNPNIKMINFSANCEERNCEMEGMKNIRLLKGKVTYNPNIKMITFQR